MAFTTSANNTPNEDKWAARQIKNDSKNTEKMVDSLTRLSVQIDELQKEVHKAVSEQTNTLSQFMKRQAEQKSVQNTVKDEESGKEADPNELLGRISRKITRSSRISQVLSALTLDIKTPFTNLTNALSLSESSFVSAMNQVVGRLNASKGSSSEDKEDSQNGDDSAKKETSARNESFLKVISEQASQIFKTDLLNTTSLEGYLLSLSTLQNLFSSLGIWTVVDKKLGDRSPIQSAIQSAFQVQLLAKSQLVPNMVEFINSFNDPILMKMLKPGPTIPGEDGEPGTAGANQIERIFDKNSGITKVFQGMSTIVTTLKDMRFGGIRAYMALKYLGKLKFATLIRQFYKEIGSSSNSPEQIKSHESVIKLFGLVKDLSGFTMKMGVELKKFSMFTRMFRPGKIIAHFYKQMSKDLIPKIVETETLDEDGRPIKTKISEGQIPFEALKNIKDIFISFSELPKIALKTWASLKLLMKLGIGRKMGDVVRELCLAIPSNVETGAMIGQFFGEKSKINPNEDPVGAWKEFFKMSYELIGGESGFYGMTQKLPKLSLKSWINLKRTQLFSISASKTLKSIFKDISKALNSFIGQNETIEETKKKYLMVSEGLSVFAASTQDFVNEMKSLGSSKEVANVFNDIGKSLYSLNKIIKMIVRDKKYFDDFPGLLDKVTAMIKLSMTDLSKLAMDKEAMVVGDDKKKQVLLKGMSAMTKSMTMMVQIVKDLAKTAVFIKLAQIAVVGISKIITLFGTIGKSKISIDLAGGVLNNMNFSLIKFAMAAAISSIFFTRMDTGGLLKGMALLFILNKVYQKIGGIQNFKQILWSSESVKHIAKSFFLFSASMAVSSVFLSKTNLGALLIGVGIMFLMSKVYEYIGHRKTARNINNASISIAMMSLSFLIFSASIALSSGIIKNIEFKNLLMSVFLLTGMAVIYGLMGVAWKFIVKGALVVAVMSLSLIIFAYSISKLSESISGWTMEKLGMSLLVMGGITALMIGIGIPAVASLALLGSAVLIVVGVSLIVFSFGLNQFLKIAFPDEKKRADMEGTFGAILWPLAKYGVFSPFIIMGAGAMLMAGLALASISDGLKKTLELDWNKVPIERISTVISILAQSFAAVSMAGGFLGALNAINPLSMLGITKTPVEKGIKSVLMANEALTSISKGLKEFDNNTKSLDLQDPKKSPNGLPARISTVLGVVNAAFSAIGASGNTNNSLIGMVFGSDFKKSDTEVGINSVLKAGQALTSVADGLLNFDNKTKSLDLQDPKKSPNGLPARIAVVLGVINKAFSDIGASGNTNNSWMGLVFGSDFKKSDTEVGINSVLKAGQALSGVAQGLQTFDSMTKNMDLQDPKKSPFGIPAKITTILGVINKVFSDIGASGNTNNSLIGMVFGSDFKKSDVEVGINSVKDVGKVFTDIAAGLKAWADLDAQKIPIDIIKTNIQKILTSISGIFAQIGSQKTGGFLGFGQGNAVEDGINAVKGVGNVFKDIADGLKIWKELEKMGLKEDDFNPDKQGGLANNIKRTILLVSEVFGSIGKNAQQTTISDILNWRPGQNVQKPTTVTSEDVKRGIDAVSGAGNELKSIGESIKVFASFTKNLNLTKVGEMMKQVILLSSQVFAQVGYGKEGDPEAVKKGIDAIKGVGNELKGIADSVRVFADIEKSQNGKPGINIEKIKANIRELVGLTVRIVGGIGGDRGAWNSLYPGSEPPQMSFLKQGEEIIKTSVSAFKELNGVVDVVSKIDMNKWTKQKEIMRDLSTAPISSIKSLADIYAKDKNIIDQSFTIIPNLKSQIENIASASASINANGNGGTGNIRALSKDFESYLQVLKKTTFNKVQLDSADRIINFFERWAKIETPFEKFTKSFKNHVEDFKQFVAELNKIDITKLNGYNDFNKITLEIIRSGSVDLANKKDLIIEFLKTFFAEASMFVDKLTAVGNSMNGMSNQTENGSSGILNGLNNMANGNYWNGQQQTRQTTQTSEGPLTIGQLQEWFTRNIEHHLSKAGLGQ